MKQTQENFYNICRYIIFKNITIYLISIKFLFFNELLATHPYSDKDLDYSGYSPTETDIIISREKYLDQLQGFWLGQSIGNWTGLITEMDKIGPPFYTHKTGVNEIKKIYGDRLYHQKILSLPIILLKTKNLGLQMMILILNICISIYWIYTTFRFLALLKSKKGGLIIYTPMKLHQKEKTFYGFQMRLLFILCLMDSLLHKQANQKTTLIIL